MFAGPFVVIALLVASCAAALLSAAQAVRAPSGQHRASEAARVLLAAVVGATALGWARSAPALLGTALAAVLLWSIASAALDRRHRRPGAAAAAYRAVLALLAAWVLSSAARAGTSPAGHPAHQLGVIVLDLLAAVLMTIAAAGWLLAAFAMPAESTSKPVPRLTGTTEALLAAALAVALYAIS
ncbi:hypothetical protein [Sinomonas sp.]|uniref:hypothetical protein n=1 Tax=Sinomonas sp. TaxID=1914986 RepID=UPI002FE19E9A